MYEDTIVQYSELRIEESIKEKKKRKKRKEKREKRKEKREHQKIERQRPRSQRITKQNKQHYHLTVPRNNKYIPVDESPLTYNASPVLCRFIVCKIFLPNIL